MTDQLRKDWLPIVVFAVGLMIQTGGVVWWASKAESRLTAAEERQVASDLAIATIRGQMGTTTEFMARIDERLHAQKATLDRVERLVEGIKP